MIPELYNHRKQCHYCGMVFRSRVQLFAHLRSYDMLPHRTNKVSVLGQCYHFAISDHSLSDGEYHKCPHCWEQIFSKEQKSAHLDKNSTHAANIPNQDDIAQAFELAETNRIIRSSCILCLRKATLPLASLYKVPWLVLLDGKTFAPCTKCYAKRFLGNHLLHFQVPHDPRLPNDILMKSQVLFDPVYEKRYYWFLLYQAMKKVSESVLHLIIEYT
jgi:uncharacterized protein with PIN domain